MSTAFKSLLLALTLSAPSLLRFADSTWTGYVTDTHCGTHCQRTSDMKPDRQCVETCVRKGSKYGLWSGNHVYVLEPQQEAAKFAAEDVVVAGVMTDGTIHITSIKAAGH